MLGFSLRRRFFLHIWGDVGFLKAVQVLMLLVDVFTKQRIHEEGKIESGRRIIRSKQNLIQRLTHIGNRAVAACRINRQRLAQNLFDFVGQRRAIA